MSQHVQMLRGQVPAGSYYPGQAPAPLRSSTGRPGQHALIGVGGYDEEQPESPKVPPGKCTKVRELDGVSQRCGAWAVKDREPQLCIGHHRERDKQVAADGYDASADSGLRQDAP